MTTVRADTTCMRPRPTQPRILAALALSLTFMGFGCAGTPPEPGGRTDSILTLFAPTSPTEAARWAVDPYDADKRQRGVRLLANASFGGEPLYIELYESALSDGDAAVRASAILGLALHGTSDHALPIARLLEDDPSPVVRRQAARALQRLHHPGAIDPLVRRLSMRVEEDVDTRANAASALGQYADRRVVQALIAALDDPRLSVNRHASESLETLTGQDFGYDAGAWIAWTNRTHEVFAERREYVYPVFQRDRTIAEWIVPFLDPPNETPATPAGASSAARDDPDYDEG